MKQTLSITEYKALTKSRHPESDLQTKITKWLKNGYPGIIFFTDFAAGLYLEKEYMRALRSMQACDGKYLDLTILEPVQPYHAFILEIKVDGKDLFLKDGKTLKSEHVQLQYDMILRLRAKGYWADFGVGEYACKTLYTQYLTGEAKYKEILPFRGTMTQDKMDRAADEFFGGCG